MSNIYHLTSIDSDSIGWFVATVTGHYFRFKAQDKAAAARADIESGVIDEVAARAKKHPELVAKSIDQLNNCYDMNGRRVKWTFNY